MESLEKILEPTFLRPYISHLNAFKPQIVFYYKIYVRVKSISDLFFFPSHSQQLELVNYTA